jgi:hypothetical protein
MGNCPAAADARAAAIGLTAACRNLILFQDRMRIAAMNTGQIIIQGTVDSEGGLTLNQPVPLPPGPVEVSVHSRLSTPSTVSAGSFWTAMEKIWAGQRARGYVPRSREEVDAEIAGLRDEAEDEIQRK